MAAGQVYTYDEVGELDEVDETVESVESELVDVIRLLELDDAKEDLDLLFENEDSPTAEDVGFWSLRDGLRHVDGRGRGCGHVCHGHCHVVVDRRSVHHS